MSTGPIDGSGGSQAPTPRPGFARHYRWLFAGGGVLLVVAGAVGYFVWKQRETRPGPGDARYEQYVEAFELGVAALDVDVGNVAEENLNRAIELIPQEPAAWANRALLNFRTNRLPQAEADLKELERRAPDVPALTKIRAAIEASRGRYPEAAALLRRSIEQDPGDIETVFYLASLVKKDSTPESGAEYQRLMEQILRARPNNQYALRERLLTAVRRSDRAAVKDTLAQMRRKAADWTLQGDETRANFAKLEQAADGPLGEELFDTALPFVHLYTAQPGFARSSEELGTEGVYRGHPLRTFLKLAPPPREPALPDGEISFTPEPLADVPAGKWDVVTPVWLTGEGNPVVMLAHAKELRRVGSPAVLESLALARDGLVPLDWNNDFRTDLLLVGPGGVRFYEQGADGNFTDVTAKTQLPPDVLKGDFTAALAADVDLDGDLDVLLARRGGPPLFVRNNFNGTFAAQPIFPEVKDARAFAWADLDFDGAPDAVVLDAQGRLHAFANERSGKFRPWPVGLPAEKFLALAITDADDDGVLDLVALRADGAIIRVSDRNKRTSWDVGELARWEVPPGAEPSSVRLLVGDLDNNGVPDLIASGATASAAWLGTAGGKFERLAAALPPGIVAAADLTGNGRLDLLALDPERKPVRHRNVGKKDYHWQTVRLRGARTADADNRINSFGVGGEVEFRTGTHVVKQPITGPVVHFGLGNRTRCDVLRIVWPNGSTQIELRMGVDAIVVAEQRLKGSCPFLFTWNGERFVFATDFMWSTPLGMYINAQDQGALLQTSEWVKVRGDQLVPRDGRYEVRINANLWETHYFDHLALRVIDHPADTELFCDERFMLVPSKPTYHLTAGPRPVARALDHRGADVTDIVRAVDGKYLDRAGRGRYQGISNDHWVEVDLGDDAPNEGPVFLVAHGWVHPTDSSVNFAIEQGEHVKPRALVLEVPDGKGGWRVAQDKLGFPAGKNKTVTLRLDGIDGPGVARRFRLRTNMEIYWDALHYARGRNDAPRTEKELLPLVADLRSRGILEMTQADPSSPELPHYDRVVSTQQVWRDLIGFHTRFGDVRPLTEKVDDRYAILTAGDELALTFAVPPAPPSGWKRDFVWVSDGWVKDGDLNTRFGKTVLPLPAHDMPNYTTPPARLEDDPIYRRHKRDWGTFHTRYVTPVGYERGLRAFKPREGKSP